MVKKRVLNIDILSLSLSELLKNIDEGILFTPNVDHMVKLQKDEAFYQSYQQANWVICDSKILKLGASFLNISFKEVIPGSSFLPAYFEYHRNNKDIKAFFLGSAEGIALTAKDNTNQKIGWDIVIGAHSPSFGFEQNPEECTIIIDIVNKSGANVLVLGVGAPKQEKWITEHKHRLPNVKLFMALGATIDFESGMIKRAPKIYQILHLEWYYRLIQEPRRLWRRYILEDIAFFGYIMKQRLGLYRNPFSNEK